MFLSNTVMNYLYNSIYVQIIVHRKLHQIRHGETQECV